MTHLPSNLVASLLIAAAFVSLPALASTGAQPQCGDEKDGTKDGKTGDSKDAPKDGKAGDTKPKAPSAF